MLNGWNGEKTQIRYHQGSKGKLVETVYGNAFLVENLHGNIKKGLGGKITQAAMVVSSSNTQKILCKPYHNSTLFCIFSENREYVFTNALNNERVPDPILAQSGEPPDHSSDNNRLPFFLSTLQIFPRN